MLCSLRDSAWYRWQRWPVQSIVARRPSTHVVLARLRGSWRRCTCTCTRHLDRSAVTWTLFRRELWRRRTTVGWLLLLSYWPLQLLLLSLAHQRRLSCKSLLEVAKEVGNVRPIPHADPVSQVWVVHSSFHTHVLPRPHQHVPPWCHIGNRRLLRVCLGDPQFDRKAVCRASKVHRQRSGGSEQQR